MKLISWIVDNWPWLALALPSVLVALTKAPKGGDAMAYVKWGLDLLSVLAHKDSPGTLKLPLTRSEPPPTVQSPPLPASALPATIEPATPWPHPQPAPPTR